MVLCSASHVIITFTFVHFKEAADKTTSFNPSLTYRLVIESMNRFFFQKLKIGKNVSMTITLSFRVQGQLKEKLSKVYQAKGGKGSCHWLRCVTAVWNSTAELVFTRRLLRCVNWILDEFVLSRMEIYTSVFKQFLQNMRTETYCWAGDNCAQQERLKVKYTRLYLHYHIYRCILMAFLFT